MSGSRPVPRRAAAEAYRQQGDIPGGTQRNWASYGHKVGEITEEQRHWLCDPQTSGGLLIAAGAEAAGEVEAALRAAQVAAAVIGTVVTPEAGVQIVVRR